MRKLLLLMFVLVLVACKPEPLVKPIDKPEPRPAPKYEITEDDIVSLIGNTNFTSDEVAVMGVRIGDSKTDALVRLGSPENFTRFEGEGLIIENLEYGESIGLDKIGLIVHIENEVVTKITVTESFNKFLSGETVIDSTDDELYFSVGVPDEKQIVYRYILLNYNSYGVQLVTFRSDQIAISLVPAGETNRVIDRNATDLLQIPLAQEIVLT